MAIGQRRGIGLVWHLGLGHRQILGDGVLVRIPRMGTNVGPMDCLCRCRFSCTWLVDVSILSKTSPLEFPLEIHIRSSRISSTEQP
jgi:hypothetical protein